MRQLRSIEHLKGFALHARDGEIGRIAQVYFDDETWVVRYFVVRTGGWLSGREVLIAPTSLRAVDEERRHIGTDLTQEQIEKSPTVDTQRPVSRQDEADLYRYYGWAPYWGVDGSYGTVAPPPLVVMQRTERVGTEPPPDPHLRASSEVRGYRVHAHGDEFGEIEDFIVDDRDWRIRYIVFDTRRWLPSKKVLLAPGWVKDIVWSQREVVVDLDRETIRSAPAYDSSAPITHEDEVLLYAHYGRRLPVETPPA